MNKGTKIRTILGILTTINTVLAVTDITQFGNERLSFYYKLVSVVINAVVVAINTYYNNDYTEEAAIGTGVTRQLKAEKRDDYVGDYFFADYDQEYIDEDPENRGEEPIEEPIEEVGELDE